MPAVEITDKVKARLNVIAARTVAGDTQKEIAEDMGLTRNALYYNITRHKDLYNELLAVNITDKITVLWERIEEMSQSDDATDRRAALVELGKMVRNIIPRFEFIQKQSLEVHVTADQLAWRTLLDYLTPSAQREVIQAVKTIEAEQTPIPVTQ